MGQNDLPEPNQSKKPFVMLVSVVVLLALAVWGYFLVKDRETPLDGAVKLVRANKAASAVPALEELARETPVDPNVYPWLAQAYLATDRIAEGRTALDTAFRLRANSDVCAPVVDRFSLYYQNVGQFAEAQRLYASALKVLPLKALALGQAQMCLSWAERDLQAKVKTDDAGEKFAAGIAHLSTAQESLKLFNGQLSEISTLKGIVSHRLAEAYRLQAAWVQLQKKDNQEAIMLLEKSLEVSDESRTHILLADLYVVARLPLKAIEHLQVASNQDSNNLEIRHKLLELLLAQKNIEAAQQALTELVDREKSFENFELLANLNLKLNDFPGAIRALEEASNMNPKPQLLKELLRILNLYAAQLMLEKKTQEAIAVKGHAERIADKLALATRDDKKDELPKSQGDGWSPGNPPVAIIASRNWLYLGSPTPEGEIRIKNVSPEPVTDLSLTAVYIDHTSKVKCGTVTMPVASSTSQPFAPQAQRTLYFSCPNIVKEDHHLGVMIFWRGKFLKEFPVVKQRS